VIGGRAVDESAKAGRYERRYPETGCSEAQKEERMDRLDFKDEAAAGRRTMRNRGIVIPDCAYFRNREEAAR
jgi:hypothetical protein